MGIYIPFGEWLPDLPENDNPGATVAKNVIPDERSYISFPGTVAYTGALGGRCRGSIVARDLAGNYYNYAGDASALYSLVSTAWTNISRTVGGAYTTPSDDVWEFTQFGSTVIGVNGFNADVPQAITVGAANFAALGGNPPRAKHVTTIRDFVVLGNISATAAQPQMVRWCAINNAASWTPDAATLADFQDLPGDGGWVQKVVGGEYGVIFQERSIYRMTFVGAPLVFQFDRIHTNIGAYCPNSVVNYQNLVFFISEDGFKLFDGNAIHHIGKGKVDRTFLADLDTTYLYRVQGFILPEKKLVLWAYPGSGNSGGNANRVMIFNYGNERWTRIEDVNYEWLTFIVAASVGIDSLDALYSSIDAMTITLDATQFAGGNRTFGVFDSTHSVATFNGSAMDAVVETPEIQLNSNVDDGLTYVTRVRPVVEGLSASCTVAIGTRMVLTGSVSYNAATSPISAGYCPVRSTSRYHRFRLSLTGDYEHLRGVDVTAKPDGVR